jgi:tetratricopeptide (TPR) repeat protein
MTRSTRSQFSLAALFLASFASPALAIDVPVTPPREATPPSAEVAAAVAAGRALRNAGRDADAMRAFDDALTKARAADDNAGEALVLNNIASIYRYQAGLAKISGNQQPPADLVAKSAELYELALKKARLAGNKSDEAYARLYLGVLAAGRDESDKAYKYYDEALALYKALDDRYYMARTYMFMGTTTLYRRDKAEESLTFFEQALPLFRDAKYWHEAQWVLRDMFVAYQLLRGRANGK